MNRNPQMSNLLLVLVRVPMQVQVLVLVMPMLFAEIDTSLVMLRHKYSLSTGISNSTNTAQNG